jgi:hypothetical protein
LTIVASSVTIRKPEQIAASPMRALAPFTAVILPGRQPRQRPRPA